MNLNLLINPNNLKDLYKWGQEQSQYAVVVNIVYDFHSYTSLYIWLTKCNPAAMTFLMSKLIFSLHFIGVKAAAWLHLDSDYQFHVIILSKINGDNCNGLLMLFYLSIAPFL